MSKRLKRDADFRQEIARLKGKIRTLPILRSRLEAAEREAKRWRESSGRWAKENADLRARLDAADAALEKPAAARTELAEASPQAECDKRCVGHIPGVDGGWFWSTRRDPAWECDGTGPAHGAGGAK